MKKFFKIFSSVFLIVILYTAWGIMLANKEDTRDFVRYTLGINRPCGKPLKFSAGQVDPRFKISKEEFETLTRNAASFWNENAGKEILKYDPEALFKINLVFDTRQAATDEAQILENNLGELGSSYDELSQKYDSLSAEYQKKIDTYNKDLEKYKERLEEYSEEVQIWNEKGGAPEDVYDDLKDEQEELAEAAKKINKKRYSTFSSNFKKYKRSF